MTAAQMTTKGPDISFSSQVYSVGQIIAIVFASETVLRALLLFFNMYWRKSAVWKKWLSYQSAEKKIDSGDVSLEKISWSEERKQRLDDGDQGTHGVLPTNPDALGPSSRPTTKRLVENAL